jgi:hypothetical protein
MPIAINGSGTLTGLSVGGLEDGIITPAELSTGAPSWDSSGNLTNVASVNAGPLAGFRNAIINGNFDIWQRGTSFTATGNIYTSDRWGVGFAGGSGRGVTYSQQAFANGQTDVPGNPKHFFRWNETTAGTSYTGKEIYQGIEGVRTFAGQQVTLSFYAKAASAITLPKVQLNQNFGTGGSPSAGVQTDVASNVSIGTSWARYTYTATMPSISGKTIGSDGNDALYIEIFLPNTGTFTFDIAQVQVEPGPVATPFERRPIGTELALCQRYFEIFSANNRYYATVGGEVSNVPLFWTPKRATPTLAQFAAGSAFNLSSTSFTASDSVSGRMENVTTGTGDSLVHNVKISASAEL